MKFKGLLLILLLTGCSSNGLLIRSNGNYPEDVQKDGYYKVGMPYKIDDKMYYPEDVDLYTEEGQASWYEDDFSGSGLTANGEKFDPLLITGAHRTLPLPSLVRVTNLENGASAIVRVNDRGPFTKNRIIDVSKRTAELLEFHQQGTTRVRVDLLVDDSKALRQELIDKGAVAKDANTLATLDKPKTQGMDPLPLTETISTALSGYFVQLGVFGDKNNALLLQKELSAYGSISLHTTEKGLYRVVMGPYTTEQEARRACETIKNNGYDALVKHRD